MIIFVISDNYEGGAGGHYFTERRSESDLADSPGQYNDSYQYGETSGSNSCDEDDERDYDGKRSGDPLSGLAAKKRRKQSKPIRLGSEEGEAGENGEGEAVEEGEVRFRRESGDSVERSQESPGQGDAPLNLSAVSKQSESEKSESGGERSQHIVQIIIIFIIPRSQSSWQRVAEEPGEGRIQTRDWLLHVLCWQLWSTKLHVPFLR